jgi:hypothetical protein
MKSAIDYNEEKKYLPEFMQDFHDQKDLFKSLHDLYSERLEKELPAFNWRDSHIYTVDFFLWFMGMHGYKLQKVKAKDVEFYDIEKTKAESKEKRVEAISKILFQREPTDLIAEKKVNNLTGEELNP